MKNESALITLDSVTTIKADAFQYPEKFACSLVNTSHAPIKFYITPAEIDLFNIQTILGDIVSDSVSVEENCIALWNFVCTWRYHNQKAPALSVFPHHPAILINSLESGICDDASIVLATLGKEAGIPTRVYYLGTHVVTEFYYDHAWHMFDADRKIFYRNSRGVIAGIELLIKHPDIFGLQQINFYNSLLAYKVINQKNKKAILCTADNYFVILKNYNFLKYNSAITLYEKDQIKFLIKPTTFFAKKIFVDMLENGGPFFDRTGYLTRNFYVTDTILSEKSPYAIDKINIQYTNDLPPVRIYYSIDSIRWYFKGIVSSGCSVTFDPRFPEMEELVLNYYLKFVCSDKKKKSALEVTNRFTFSDKLFFNNDLRSFKIKTLSGDYRNINFKIDCERK